MVTRGLRILFTTVAGSGHLNPVVPLAQALARRGHEVRLATASSCAGAVAAAGLEFVPAGVALDGPEFSAAQRDFGARPPVEQLRWFIGTTATPQAADLVRVAGDWRPDLIVRDNLDFGAWVAAEELGIPAVVFGVTSVMAKPVAQLLLGDVLADLRETRELAPDPELSSLYGRLYLDPTPPSLSDANLPPMPERSPIRPDMHYGAPGPVPEWLDDLGDRRCVYVTLGTVVNRTTSVFRTVLEALAGEDLDVVLTTGSQDGLGELGPLPANVHAAAYIPQDRILPKASAVVCHAGRGTTYGALAAGVPLCLIPLGTEQPLVAAACERAGVAVVCATTTAQMGPIAAPLTIPADLRADAVRSAVDRILGDAALQANVRRVQAEIAAMPSPEEAAAAVEEVARAEAAA